MRKLLSNIRFVPKMLMLMGIVFLFPLLMLLPYPEDRPYAPGFLYAAGIAVLCAVLLQLRYMFLPQQRPGRQRPVVTVVGFWIFIMLLGALPFYAGRQLGLMQSIMESVSGWTTTGFTAYVSVDAAPRIFLFYRGFMQFCGGLGFVVLLLLFARGREAMSFYNAEGHGDLLEPNVAGTARAIAIIYLGMVLGGAGLYMIFGMDWFDAINHSFAALGTGGFSTRDANIGAYDSIPIEAVSIVLMLLGATNFAALALMIKRKWRSFFKLRDIRFFLLILGAAVTVLAFLGLGGVYASFGESFRQSIFLAVSSITTTGFSLEATGHWPASMTYIIFLLMFVGGASGSTAGGIKYTRIYILYKSLVHNMKCKFRPERSVNLLSVQGVYGKMQLSSETIAQHQRVALLYLATFFAGAFLLTLDGMSMEAAMYEFASSLGTIGLSGGQTGPNSSTYVLVVQTLGMLLARMEVYIIYIFAAAGVREFLRGLRGIRQRIFDAMERKGKQV